MKQRLFRHSWTQKNSSKRRQGKAYRVPSCQPALQFNGSSVGAKKSRTSTTFSKNPSKNQAKNELRCGCRPDGVPDKKKNESVHGKQNRRWKRVIRGANLVAKEFRKEPRLVDQAPSFGGNQFPINPCNGFAVSCLGIFFSSSSGRSCTMHMGLSLAGLR